MSAKVELFKLGFAVVDDEALVPRSMPGRVLVFNARHDAQALADAYNADDMPACHAAIERGRWFQAETG